MRTFVAGSLGVVMEKIIYVYKRYDSGEMMSVVGCLQKRMSVQKTKGVLSLFSMGHHALLHEPILMCW